MNLEEALAAVVRAELAPVLRELSDLREAVHAVTPPRFGTVAEAARVLGCSEQTIRARIADGRVEATRIGRAVRVDLSSLRGTPTLEIAKLAREARRA